MNNDRDYVTVKIHKYDLLEMLMDRLDYWKPEPIVRDLYEQMYEHLIDDDAFDNMKFDVMSIVDNDWVNYCEVLSEGEENYDETLEAYNDGDFETEHGYIEAVIEKDGKPVFLIRYN